VADASVPRGPSPDAGWGPATSVRSSAAEAPAHRAAPPVRNGHDHNAAWDAAFHPQATRSSARDRLQATGRATRERGLPGWVGLLVLAGITVVGILVDAAAGHQLATGFNVGIIAGSIIAILVVRRSGMFPVVVAPPIVYSLGAGISLYVRSGGLHDRGVLIDAATNWLVYGFPAIAAASASVLIIAGIRLIVRR
jgi:hypothetical protein